MALAPEVPPRYAPLWPEDSDDDGIPSLRSDDSALSDEVDCDSPCSATAERLADDVPSAERDKLTIRFGDILVAQNGWRNPDYKEEDGASYMQGQELVFAVDLGLGKAKRSVWTCDLTSRYIEINADYRS